MAAATTARASLTAAPGIDQLRELLWLFPGGRWEFNRRRSTKTLRAALLERWKGAQWRDEHVNVDAGEECSPCAIGH